MVGGNTIDDVSQLENSYRRDQVNMSHQLMALRITTAFSTTSNEAPLVVAGIIDVLVKDCAVSCKTLAGAYRTQECGKVGVVLSLGKQMGRLYEESMDTQTHS